MNRHSLVAIIGCFLSWTAAASDFSCLQALIPASSHYWITTHRTQFSIPRVSAEGSSIAIPQWEHDHLTNVYVYTEKSSRRFDRITAFGESSPQPLTSLTDEWLKSHLVATKAENLEVFQIQVEPPGGWDRKTVHMRSAASEPELGGWLVESEKPGDVATPIRTEIKLRQDWVRDNNLNAERFKAWSKAEKICLQK